MQSKDMPDSYSLDLLSDKLYTYRYTFCNQSIMIFLHL